MHLEHYNQPKLQIRVVRILWMVPIYAADSWLSLRFKEARFYIDPLRECYEARGGGQGRGEGAGGGWGRWAVGPRWRAGSWGPGAAAARAWHGLSAWPAAQEARHSLAQQRKKRPFPGVRAGLLLPV